jgi:hypothetical protein
MANLSGIVKQLKKERDRAESELTRLNAALAAFVGVYTSKPKRRRKLSAKARAKIAPAQRARWAKVRAKQKIS